MATPKLLPPVAFLRQCFICKPRLGTLTWKRRPREHFNSDAEWKKFNTRWRGRSAGWRDGAQGVCVHICSVKYKVHRIIFKMVTGKEPPETIDHKDGDPGDNRFSKLRPATPSQQKYNQGIYKNNTSGVPGVHMQKGRWIVTVNRQYIGSFAVFEEAVAARDAAARRMQGAYRRNHIRPQETQTC